VRADAIGAYDVWRLGCQIGNPSEFASRAGYRHSQPVGYVSLASLTTVRKDRRGTQCII
jgi:hypothetical protein